MTMTINPLGYCSFLIDCRLQREFLIDVCVRDVGIVVFFLFSFFLCSRLYSLGFVYANQLENNLSDEF